MGTAAARLSSWLRAFALGLLLLVPACSLSPPRSFIRTFDQAGTWANVEVRAELVGKKDQLWQTVVDALSQKFDLEILDKEAGYLRTSWKYTYIYDERVVDQYRARIIVKFRGDYWPVIQVKSEAHWLESGGWSQGYDTTLLEDAYGDLQGRVGRVRR